MIKLKRDSQKGVTLVTLSIAIIIMMIITSVLIYNITTGSKVKALNNMYYDITKIKDKLDMYYINYHTIPILETPYKNTSHIQGINPNDNGVYYVIDLEALESMNLNYGQDYNTYKSNPSDTLTNLYIVNERSHSIYYAQGVLFDNKTYYTKPEESTKVELDSITNIEKVKQDQNIAVLRLNAIDKENGIRQIKLMINGEEYKTYEYTSEPLEIKIEIVNVPLVFGDNYDCCLQIIDKNNGITESEHMLIQNLTTIATAEDLKNLATLVNSGETFKEKTIELINDVDLEGNEENQWVPIGNEENAFEGTFDGDKHTISNLYINETTREYNGLFGISSGTIKNIQVSGTIKTTTAYVGGIVAKSEKGTVERCSTNINIECGGERCGGIVGYVNEATISYCYNEHSILGTGRIAGIIGDSIGKTTVRNCYNKAKIEGTTHSIAGIVGGMSDNAKIDSCYNLADVTGTKNGIAGIVGYICGTTQVSNSYNIGNIHGGTHGVGGIVGIAYGDSTEDNVIISNSYSKGIITSDSMLSHVKGILGWKASGANGKIQNCYYLKGSGATDDSNATSKTEEELKALATTLGTAYTNDTNNINDGYPILKWQEEN